MRQDRRAVSTAVSHVLTLAITAILISSLLLASEGLLTDQRENVAEHELTVIGERLALEITQVDQLNDGKSTDATLRTDHPVLIAGSSYTITLEKSPKSGIATVRLDAAGVAEPVVVPLRISTAIESGTVSGGDIRIVLSNGNRGGSQVIKLESENG